MELIKPVIKAGIVYWVTRLDSTIYSRFEVSKMSASIVNIVSTSYYKDNHEISDIREYMTTTTILQKPTDLKIFTTKQEAVNCDKSGVNLLQQIDRLNCILNK